MNSRASGLWVGVAMVLFAACGETPASLCKEDNPTSVLRSLRALELPQRSFAVGIWSFENDSDDFLGQSNATSTGVEFQRFGCTTENIYSAYFDSDSDRIEVPHTAQIHSMQRFTIAAWVKWDGSGTGYQRIVERSKNSGGGTPIFNLMVNANSGGRIMAEANTGTNVEFTSAASVTPGEWTFIVSTFDGALLRIYKNGVFVDSTAVSGTLVTADDNRSIGVGNQVERSRGFRGHLAELGLWSEALTDAEIQSLHSRSFQK